MQSQSYKDLAILGRKKLLIFNEAHAEMEVVGRVLELTCQGFDVHLVYELPNFPAVFWMIPEATKIFVQAKKEAEFKMKQVNAMLGLSSNNLYILSKMEINILKEQLKKEQCDKHQDDFLDFLSKTKSIPFSHQLSLVRMA